MTRRSDKSAAPGPKSGIRDLASYGLIVSAVVLAWQMALQPLMQRAPVEGAIRVAPRSALVLRRAAEAELAAGRVDTAASLSRDALARSPFDVRALRVLGLTEARQGRDDAADDLLTLAGNWSLRDDSAHGWLVERRLRQGDYASAFAHADTLARRRPDVGPQVFQLFTTAGIQDPQGSLPAIAALLATRPPWRGAYLASLAGSAQQIQLAANLALFLEPGEARLTVAESQHLYLNLLRTHSYSALVAIRARLGRNPSGVGVANGGFADVDLPAPFQWSFSQRLGVAAEVITDDLRPGNPALRVDYDGFAAGKIAEQLTTLRAGPHRFNAEVRTEAGDPAERLVWTLTCANGRTAFASMSAGLPVPAPGGWAPLSSGFNVPADCPAQWLRLEARPADRRAQTTVWFDKVTISPTG